MKILKVGDCKGGLLDCLVDDDVYETAILHSWCLKGKPGKAYVGRSARKGNKSLNIKLHREVVGAIKGEEVDHINHNRLDNRRENLRICSKTQNMHNIPNGRGKSSYKGVSMDSRVKFKKWRATIVVNKKQIGLGYYLTELEAALAYNKAALQYFGEYACINKCD